MAKRAFEYRHINPDEVKFVLRRENALQTERTAFAAEVEVERLEAAGAPPDVTERARKSAVEARGHAKAWNKSAKLPKREIGDVRRTFLEEWLGTIEREHAVHSEMKAILGDDATQHDEALKILEAAHEVALAHLAALDA